MADIHQRAAAYKLKSRREIFGDLNASDRRTLQLKNNKLQNSSCISSDQIEQVVNNAYPPKSSENAFVDFGQVTNQSQLPQLNDIEKRFPLLSALLDEPDDYVPATATTRCFQIIWTNRDIQ